MINDLTSRNLMTDFFYKFSIFHSQLLVFYLQVDWKVLTCFSDTYDVLWNVPSNRKFGYINKKFWSWIELKNRGCGPESWQRKSFLTSNFD